MIGNKAIARAISAIAERDPEASRTLQAWLDQGRITVPGRGAARRERDLYFCCDGKRVPVRKFSYFSEGPAVLEERLLVQLGAHRKRNDLAAAGEASGAPAEIRSAAAAEIRSAGGRLAARYEVERTLEAVRRVRSSDPELAAVLGRIAAEDPALAVPRDAADPAVLFQGSVGGGVPALFARFPFCMDALAQTADLNLEYFHVRFVLRCLIEGARLYACLVDGKIAGLVFLVLRKALLADAVEIKYMAACGAFADAGGDERLRSLKGVGTFLAAGAWMLWKTRLPNARELFLESETGAHRFYESVGFRLRWGCNYMFEAPRGFMAQAAEEMAKNLPEVPQAVARALDLPGRRGQTQTESGAAPSSAAPNRTKPLAVVRSERFGLHLKDVFHLESPGRVRAVDEALAHPSLQGLWMQLEPRPATREELAWCHTPDHIEAVARTAGQVLASFDRDTQTTAESFHVACLAAGAVFELVAAVWQGRARRGFACIRPPGHHAEPGKAMGFCLFNNVALGAHYLHKRCGARRVMIVDVDAHHGNGTQAAFYDTDAVLYVSAHLYPGYPGTGGAGEVGVGRGEGFTVNVPLRSGHGDADFVRVVHCLAGPLARQYAPEMILVSLGFDLYWRDPLGGMSCTPGGYALMTRSLIEAAEEVCGGRIAFVMEGGYSATGIRECSLRVFEELCGVAPQGGKKMERLAGKDASQVAALGKVLAVQRKYWRL